MINVFYANGYVAAAHPFDTTRKAAWVADSLRDDAIDGVLLARPEPLTSDQLETIHAHAYVEAVRTGHPPELAESNGLPWDQGLWTAVCASNGGAVAAAMSALGTGRNAGSLSSGLHHAKRDRGDGFCTFNGLALAASAARRAGAQRVLILDLDAHMGGGTHGLIRRMDGVTQTDLAVCPYVDAYEPSPGSGSSLNIIGQAREYLPRLRERLAAVRVRPDLVLYNAGMDPHEKSGIGALRGVTTDLLAEREATVFDWARGQGIPVAFVLAGGYVSTGRNGLTADTLVDLHRLTIAAAASDTDQ
jgi:acetoin utilization deacetylase AcuC-like enzyme